MDFLISRVDILAAFPPGRARARWLRWLRAQQSVTPDVRLGIQSIWEPGTAWTTRRGRLQDARMPLSLEDLEAAAWACKAMSCQKERDAAAIENPTVRGPLELAAKRYADLARRFEAAAFQRKKST